MLSFFPIPVILIYHLLPFSFLLIVNSLLLNVFIHNLLIICSILILIFLIKIEISVLISLFSVFHVQCQIQGYHEDLLDEWGITKGMALVIEHAHFLLFYLLIRPRCNSIHDVKVFQAHRSHLSLFFHLLSH